MTCQRFVQIDIILLMQYYVPCVVFSLQILPFCEQQETGVPDGRNSQRQSPCRQPIMSNTGEFYDVPKNLKAGSFAGMT